MPGSLVGVLFTPSPPRGPPIGPFLRKFLRTEAAGGAVLLAAAAVALLWANSPWRAGYSSFWSEHARHVVNEGPMALFFLVAGLEIQRELVSGELRTWRVAALPVFAAAGGMAVPALVFAAVNRGGPGEYGWGIPMATDIAFAVGVVSLVGARVHPSLKVFLLTLAVADDVGAIAVIAVAYGRGVHAVALAAAIGLLAGAIVLRRDGRAPPSVYTVVGLGLWLATLLSGVHATIAGAALGLVLPAAIAERVEGRLHPIVTFAVLPFFALANAGVTLDGDVLGAAGSGRVAAGIVLGLVVGKPVGVMACSWLAVRLGAGALPSGVGWRGLAGVSVVAGVGFTVSLFIADLAFAGESLRVAAKVGILTGSAVAALAGLGVLRRAGPRPG